MRQIYSFFDGGELEFDDSRSVKELIAHAFATFGYYEPMGMDVVTLFQAHHPDTNIGWFTTDVNLSCAEEIKNRMELCFAYHMPNVFYFAEGGWGHHMISLGNHPQIDHPVSLSIQFEDFHNEVVINGKYTFTDIVRVLKNTEYIDRDCSHVEFIPIGCAQKSYYVPLTDPIMNVALTDFEKMLDRYNKERIRLSEGDFIYHTVLRIC